MSKNILDGVLVEMSPSMISAFDADTAFGCERKGFFKYVMGLPEPQTGNQELGEALHKLCEDRLLTGKTPSGEGEAFGLYLAGQAMIESVAARKVIGVEHILPTFLISGVPINKDLKRDKKYLSKTDVLTEDGIVDWKTSSDIRRYGKTASELATDTQMVIYAKALLPHVPLVKLAHGQFQTKGRKSTDFVEVEVSQQHLDDHIGKVIIPKVERMKVVASMTNAEDAVPNREKCFNCAFRARCPTEESKNVMSFFAKFKSPSQSSTPVPAGALLNDGSMAVKAEPRVDPKVSSMFAHEAPVSPTDAPASKPELAADPVKGFEAVPPPKTKPSMKIVDEEPEMTPTQIATAKANDAAVAADKAKLLAAIAIDAAHKKEVVLGVDEDPKTGTTTILKGTVDGGVVTVTSEETVKRGRGRPPGAKNKPKQPDDHVVDTYVQTQPEGERKFKSITIARGATINVGNFNSVRFDVSVTSEEHTYEEVYAEVSKRLDDEAAKYEAEMAKGSSVPAKGVVSK